jgi:adenosine/AMP kinase
VVPVDKPDDVNVVIGQAHFIKTVEDLHEAMVGVSSSAPLATRVGIALSRTPHLDELRVAWASAAAFSNRRRPS